MAKRTIARPPAPVTGSSQGFHFGIPNHGSIHPTGRFATAILHSRLQHGIKVGLVELKLEIRGK
jgi:hypothetical protein